MQAKPRWRPRGAKRLEEAGLDLQDIRPMMNVYPSPGYSTEFFHCFLAVVIWIWGLRGCMDCKAKVKIFARM